MDYSLELNKLIKQNATLGIDISSCNGQIDWNYLLDMYTWISRIIVKCSDGKNLDDKFISNIHGLRSYSKRPIEIGAYCVIKPDQNGFEQGTYALEQFNSIEFVPDILLVDAETRYVKSHKDVAQNIMDMCGVLQNGTGVEVGVYSYFSWIKPMLEFLPDNQKYAIANYSEMFPDNYPIKQENIKIRQFSGWINDCGCTGFVHNWVPCQSPLHKHGTLLKINKDSLGMPIDIDLFID